MCVSVCKLHDIVHVGWREDERRGIVEEGWEKSVEERGGGGGGGVGGCEVGQ